MTTGEQAKRFHALDNLFFFFFILMNILCDFSRGTIVIAGSRLYNIYYLV